MSLSSDIARTLKDMERLQGTTSTEPLTLTWNGKAYPCSRGEASNDRRLSAGGLLVESDLVLCVRTEVFTDALPQQNQKVTVDSQDYKIDAVVSFPGYLRLECNQWRKR